MQPKTKQRDSQDATNTYKQVQDNKTHTKRLEGSI